MELICMIVQFVYLNFMFMIIVLNLNVICKIVGIFKCYDIKFEVIEFCV